MQKKESLLAFQNEVQIYGLAWNIIGAAFYGLINPNLNVGVVALLNMMIVRNKTLFLEHVRCEKIIT